MIFGLGGSTVGAYYRRLTLRMNTGKAITAVAHKLARVIYAMLTGQSEYVEAQHTVHEERYRQKAIKAMKRRAAQLGFDLVAVPPAPAT